MSTLTSTPVQGLLTSGALLTLLVLASSLRHAEARKLGQTCISNSNCDDGLHCQTCIAAGKLKPTCTRIKPLDPKAKRKALPFNRYSWLTTHNSFSLLKGKPTVTLYNQQDSITEQLENGVRGLMLDLYDFRNDIWLCHSFNGTCYDLTAFQPAINTLKEIRTFLEANLEEIITIIIEDYVTSPRGITKLFEAAGLRKYWFPISRMPRRGGNWPTIADMIAKNQRLVVFTSKSAKEGSEGIAYQWRYMVENQYGDDGMKEGSCPKRAESSPMNAKSRSLVLMNYFPTIPNFAAACKHNSKSLLDMLETCQKASGGRWANFITVDFYKRSYGGGAPLVTDVANGHLVCGCGNIASCKNNDTQFGQCDDDPEAAYYSGGPRDVDSSGKWRLRAGLPLLVWVALFS